MKHIILLLFTGVLLHTLSSCKDKDLTRGVLEQCSVIATRQIINTEDTLVVCDVTAVKESFSLPLSLLIDSFEVVRLENTDAALINGGHVSVSKKYIGIRNYENGPYKLFSRQGKLIGTIGKVGQGPGEYGLLCDDLIDEESNCIYLFPRTSKHILVYDLEGNYLRNIPLPRLVHKGFFSVNTSNSQVCIINLPFINTPVSWLQDFDGKVVHEKLVDQLQLEPDYSNEILGNRLCDSSMAFSLCYNIPTSDSLYHYNWKENIIKPVFTATFNENIPIHCLYELPSYYIIGILGASTDPKYTATINKRIIIDKKTLRGGYYQLIIDQWGGIPFEGDDYYNEYGCISNIEPGKLLEQIERRLTDNSSSSNDKKLLKNLEGSISEDDNNLIIIGKWKQR